jgi:hypothetical protein
MRSVDPYDAELAADARADEAQARARGDRLYTLADAIVSELEVVGYLSSRSKGPARIHTFTVLADHLYGTAAIEIPRRLGSRGEEAS